MATFSEYLSEFDDKEKTRLKRLVFLNAMGIDVPGDYGHVITKLTKVLAYKTMFKMVTPTSEFECYLDENENLVFYISDMMGGRVIILGKKYSDTLEYIEKKYKTRSDSIFISKAILRKNGVGFRYFTRDIVHFEIVEGLLSKKFKTK